MKAKQFLGIIIIFITMLSGTTRTIGAEGLSFMGHDPVETGDDTFDKKFREGRELIDKEEWAAAAAKFSEIVCDCPDKKGVDAAFYWLAFSYKKLNKFGEMNTAIDRLQKNFPNSSWVDDARLLRLRQTSPAYAPSTSGQGSGNLARTALGLAYEEQKIPLDREEEFRLAAFQSLFTSDPGRAVNVLGEIIVPNSKTSENLQARMLSSVRGTGFTGLATTTGSYSVSGSSSATTLNSESVKTANSRLSINKQLGDMLVSRYPALTSSRIRTEIIYLFGTFDDSAERLSRIYGAENDKQVKKAIIAALGNGGYAPFNLADSGTARKRNLEKLIEIVRAENDPELSIAGIRALGYFGGWSKDGQVVEALSQIYTNDANDELKSALVLALSQARSERANARLIEIARSDRSDRIRLEAIRALRGSNDPQVIRFLEELIK